MQFIKGQTSQSVEIPILDSTSTTGGRKTGLVFNTAGLTAYYVRHGGLATAITLATLAAANSAYSSGGFKEIDATNMPGLYRFDIPDAVLASGVNGAAIVFKGATGMVQVEYGIELVDDVYARIGAPVGASISADVAGVQSDTNDLQTRVPAALTGAGNMKSDALALSGDTLAADNAESFFDGTGYAGTGNVIPLVTDITTKTGFSLSSAGIQAIWDALTSALTTVGSIGKLLVDNINATISSRLATAGYTAPATVGDIADQVWDETLAGHLGAGSTGEALNAAGAAGDPWTTALPGAYGAGSAGKIIGDNVNATISSRATPAQVNTEANTALLDVGLTSTVTGRIDAAITTRASQATLDTLDNFVDNEITEIKAKTDNLPASPAAVGSAMTLAADSVTAAALAADALAEIKAALQTTALPESYAALGAEPTEVQLLYEIRALLAEHGLVLTTLTTKRLDGTTTAAEYATDSATTPTSLTRSA